jgi:nicotinamidase-related amidase
MLMAPAESLLPFDASCTALVIPDPWHRLVSDDGRFRFLPWGPPPPELAASNFMALVRAAHRNRVPVLISPHPYYPMDHGWQLEDGLEQLLQQVGMFQNRGPWVLDHSADGMPGNLAGHESLGLTLELDRRGVQRILLAGLLADHSLRSHLAELKDQGFEVGLVQDAAAQVEILGQTLLPPTIELPPELLFATQDVVGVLHRGSVH